MGEVAGSCELNPVISHIRNRTLEGETERLSRDIFLSGTFVGDVNVYRSTVSYGWNVRMWYRGAGKGGNWT